MFSSAMVEWKVSGGAHFAFTNIITATATTTHHYTTTTTTTPLICLSTQPFSP